MAHEYGTVGAVIVAAGSGTRMEGLDKLLTLIAGRTLLAHGVAAFENCPEVDRIVVVLSERDLKRGREAMTTNGFTKVAGYCIGGARRQDSVRSGLLALGTVDWVAVHDGGRPLVRPGMITRGLEAAQATGAAVPVVPLIDTVKEVADDGMVVRTLDRSRLWAVQTPQVFRYDLLLRAHEEVTDDVTDDAAMLERMGLPVATFEGRRHNIKITTPDDLTVAEALLE